MLTFLLLSQLSPLAATDVNEVVSHLVGVMDTTAQAQAHPQAPSVVMTTCQVMVSDHENESYLYQEQALTKTLNQPYRQRILKIQLATDGQAVESKSFKLNHPENMIGFCNKPQSERVIPEDALTESVCSVFLKPTPEGYIGETPAGGCQAHVRGAVTITNTIVLHKDGMDTWDRGYDAQGNILWGARQEAYQFRWQKPR